MGRRCALLVPDTKVISRSHHLLERTDGDTFLVGYHLNTYFWKIKGSAYIVGVLIPPCLPLLHPFPQGLIEQAKLQLCISV